MLGVRKVRSHSCKCIEQSSLLLLSKTAFRALVEKTGRNRTEQNMVGLAGLGDMNKGFTWVSVHPLSTLVNTPKMHN